MGNTLSRSEDSGLPLRGRAYLHRTVSSGMLMSRCLHILMRRILLIASVTWGVDNRTLSYYGD